MARRGIRRDAATDSETMSTQPKIRELKLAPGRKVGTHYVVESLLGSGSEGEVYRIRDLETDIHRAAKLYYPRGGRERDLAIYHARKLHNLQFCPIVLQYHHFEQVRIGEHKILAMVSDLCEGIQLEKWIAQQRGGRLSPYMALHVLFHLAGGLELIHSAGEYHADVHSQNILIRPHGIGFELKLIDFYDWGESSHEKQQQDVRDTVHVFAECLGGPTRLGKLSRELRFILGGLRRQTILERFPTMATLRQHLRSFHWDRL